MQHMLYMHIGNLALAQNRSLSLLLKCRTFKIVKKYNCVLKKFLKFEIYLKIKNFNKILKNIKKIKNNLMDFIKVCESFEQFK